MNSEFDLFVQVADWMQCLPFEIEVIWAAKWNLVKILYMLNRYFLIDIFLYYVCEFVQVKCNQIQETHFPVTLDLDIADVEVSSVFNEQFGEWPGLTLHNRRHGPDVYSVFHWIWK